MHNRHDAEERAQISLSSLGRGIQSTVNNERDQASIWLDWLWKAAMRRHKRTFSHLRMREKL
jgi:hypothetical protein